MSVNNKYATMKKQQEKNSFGMYVKMEIIRCQNKKT